MTTKEFLSEKSAKTEAALDAYLDTWEGAPSKLIDAIRYSLFARGKRLRPALALGAADIISGNDKPALPVACALEMIHTYSLIHDDLPAMDDDDLRRGKPTLHKAFDEATAILAGDTMLTMAFDIAVQTGSTPIIQELARAAGVHGMAGGQLMDLEAETKKLSLEELQRIHAAKTGALIRASVRTGAMAAAVDGPALAALTRYGEHIGLAFQITDDILDVVGSEEALGKPVGSDVSNDKSTYPAIVGLDRARELAEETASKAVDALNCFGNEAGVFRDLARFVVERES